MRVRALLPYPFDTSPSQRYRIEQWMRPLEQLGITVEPRFLFEDRKYLEGLWRRPPSVLSFARLLAATAGRMRDVVRGSRPDAWLVHREMTMFGPPVLERMLARRGAFVLDFDDAIWLGLGDLTGRRTLADRVRRPEKTNEILALASGVSAGNAYLAGHAARFNANVEVVPTTVDVNGTYNLTRPRERVTPFTLGWSGSHSTAQYLQALLPVLREVAQDVDFRLVIIGAVLADPGLDIECRPWRSVTEAQDLLDVDVGLMPIPDDIWTRGKCGLKALQYMALGIPPLLSPYGVNGSIVTHGENGLHAGDPEGWRAGIMALRDEKLRMQLGDAARETVREGFSAEVGAACLAKLLARVA